MKEYYLDLGTIIPLNFTKEWFDFIMFNKDKEFWSYEGWSGIPEEPFRHWCKYPKFQGIYKNIWDFISTELPLTLFPERVIVNAYSHGDSSWLHEDSKEPNHYTVIVYLNPEWDINRGGETIIIGIGGDIIHAALPTPGRVLLFDSRLTHGPRPVSREAPWPRLGVTFQCIKQ